MQHWHWAFKMSIAIHSIGELPPPEPPPQNAHTGCQVQDTEWSQAQDEPSATLTFPFCQWQAASSSVVHLKCTFAICLLSANDKTSSCGICLEISLGSKLSPSFTCSSKMNTCSSMARVTELFTRSARLFRLIRNKFNFSSSRLFACFHGCSIVCFIQYMETLGILRILQHNTQVKTMTNDPKEKILA